MIADLRGLWNGRGRTMAKVWLFLGFLYAGFLFWYGGCGAPLTSEEVERISAQIDAQASSSDAAARLKEFARGDDGREFFMVNLNRYRAVPQYADGRPTGGASSEEIERQYTSKMLPRLLRRACHPWVATALPNGSKDRVARRRLLGCYAVRCWSERKI